MLRRTGQKNLCLSGGFFLNCVSNYHLLKNLPDDVQIYVEPISSDAGNALGAAKFLYHTLTKDMTIRPQTNIYYGLEHNIKLSDLKDEKIIENVTPTDVAKLLADKKIVALYQGRSEAGPRALGNRSILYDPRDPNGKDHVNTVKKREWFRPFAGTVLLEKARDWFDLRSLTESKFMMFAVDVWPDKQALIPSITHVDGTCRVQTLKREDNPNYYDLIQEFDKLTGVPILFNTSFNLAGNTIVETLKDALWTIHNSAIDYLYLPELKVLVTKAP
jgi:carbamoyltransferase